MFKYRRLEISKNGSLGFRRYVDEEEARNVVQINGKHLQPYTSWLLLEDWQVLMDTHATYSSTMTLFEV